MRRLKKFDAGEGARYMSRKVALRKLQMSLKDFRFICIVKGIYPREPKNRRRAQKGKTGIQTLYLKKDIQFLMHDPLYWNIRDLKVHLERIKRARSMKDNGAVKRYSSTIPILNLDHIVKERYPTFVDALRDLDDSLTLCFLFASMPRMNHIPPHLIAFCRRLTIEFMHFVIASKALRYVFVSIKGIYYQADVKGQAITWIVPHAFAFQPHSNREVDFKTMATFVEFYTTLLGFANFRLYHGLNLKYPPQLQGMLPEEHEVELIDDRVALSDRVAALNVPLQTTGPFVDESDQDTAIDEIPLGDDEEAATKAREQYELMRNLKKLFQGLRVFLNREVPRESLVFVLRSFGATVSWDAAIFPGSTFQEGDESITHQIVDRKSVEKTYISRYYVQPQWVYDSVNARKLLPVEKYLMGATLPPHLSPFMEEFRKQRYVPLEEKALKDPSAKEEKAVIRDEDVSDESDSGVQDMVVDGDNDKSDETDEEMEDDDKMKSMKVEEGQMSRPNKNKERKDHHQNLLMREKLIRKKYRKLYKSMKQGKINREKEIKLLKYKRKLNERKELVERKAKVRALRAKNACK